MFCFLKTLILITQLFFLETPLVYSSRASDRQILLRFKSSVTDPSGMLSSWNPSSDHCSWSGVYCDAASRVSSLIIPGGNCPNPNPPATPLLRRRRCGGGGGMLNGSLTASLGGLYRLRVLSLPFHRLGGEIAASIWSLPNLEVLDLEGNAVSCRPPRRLFRLQVVKSEVLDLRLDSIGGPSHPPYSVVLHCSPSIHFSTPLAIKYSHFSTTPTTSTTPTPISTPPPIPHKTAEGLPGRRKLEEEGPSVGAGEAGGLSSIGLACLISGSAIASVLVALLLLFVCIRKGAGAKVEAREAREITLFSDPGVHLTFEAVVQATCHFGAGKCIGSGGFGATYKAEVSPGVVVAVKRVSVGRFVQGVQQFHAEIKTLGRIRHPNLVTLIGYHASRAEMFLVYNYLPGGNLERFIREGGAAEWGVVHRVASQVAAALAYLHDDCVPRVLHRDVKPSNILLDARLNAYLSDFGLSRLMGATETHATTGVAGTFGYVAPEYAMTCRVSEKSDVYSYGVVLLELISDKKALDPSFSHHGNGFNIVSWACLLLRQGRAAEVFTRGLWEDGPQSRLVALLHLAVMCTVDSLSIRPTMKQVVHRLSQLHSAAG